MTLDDLLRMFTMGTPSPPGPVFTKPLEPNMTPRSGVPNSRLDSVHLERDTKTRTPFDLSIFNADMTPRIRRGLLAGD
jgi:hypothetical protein